MLNIVENTDDSSKTGRSAGLPGVDETGVDETGVGRDRRWTNTSAG
jgi:hypothetical protein